MKATMKILYGPPGTGKTWLAARDAIKAVAPERLDAISKNDPDYDDKVRELHKNLVAEGRILWVTFHPSYSYEDFVEGYRPESNDKGDILYKVQNGPFKALCETASTRDIEVGDRIANSSGQEGYEVIGKDSGGWIIRSIVNRSDAINGVADRYVDRFSLDRVADTDLPPQIFSIPGSPLLNLSDYGLDASDSDVLAIPPDTTKGETLDRRIGASVRRIVARRTGLSTSLVSNSSHYAAVYRRRREIQREAATTAGYAIVIDEINRADLSKVFGELLTLIELDKREGEREEKTIYLPYSKELFSVPKNISIIGTMNTVDRSISHMDFAFRRRFSFEFVGPDAELCVKSFGGVDLGPILALVNQRIAILLGKEFCIGHSIFMQQELQSLKDSNDWGGEEGELKCVAAIFQKKLIPLLLEYFKDDWKKVEAVAGISGNDENSLSLFASTEADETLIARLDHEYDLISADTWSGQNWANPVHKDWDPEKFKRFLQGLEEEAAIL